jgi:hypothetical protein
VKTVLAPPLAVVPVGVQVVYEEVLGRGGQSKLFFVKPISHSGRGSRPGQQGRRHCGAPKRLRYDVGQGLGGWQTHPGKALNETSANPSPPTARSYKEAFYLPKLRRPVKPFFVAMSHPCHGAHPGQQSTLHYCTIKSPTMIAKALAGGRHTGKALNETSANPL